MSKPVCPYCGSKAELVSSAKVYQGRDFGKIWCCSQWPSCDSYVGADDDGKPLGRLANKELRRWKILAHAAFDPLWKAKSIRSKMPEGKAKGKGYQWLALQLGIPSSECHIAMFDVDMCKRVVELCTPWLKKLKNY
jgi:zinc-finger-containing domain